MVKVFDFFVGMVVFLGTNTFITPSAVFIPSESGVTSIDNKQSVYYDPCPLRMAAWTAAP